MSSWGTAVVISLCTLACGGSQPQPQSEPQVIRGDFYMEADETPVSAPGTEAAACCDKPTHRDQPPEVKLALGHYSNAKRGIGAVIDVTQKVGKLRYDGTDKTIELYASPGPYGRTDYHKNASVVLMAIGDDGHVVVFLDAPTARDGIAMTRDADADPL
jgi:hypothetical protein